MPDDFIENDNYYKELGLRCGLEIHQQLLTEKKLFCRCDAVLHRDEPSAIILRHMRPTLSELGEYDGTALMEFKTKKNVISLIKERNLLRSIPETYTIQKVLNSLYPYFFPNFIKLTFT